ncbi:MAG: CHAD domain-containing protein [Anaerolineales bacterium]|nr:CHAD domain-containing protein [Anaerolineales bacterium]
MEVEAKYTLPDAAAYERLLALVTLGGCDLRPAATKQFSDHYADTPDRALFAAGYALRRRNTGRRWRATLKSLGAAEGALHQREEIEADIAPGALPADWPAGPARDLALRLAGGAPLVELFALRQTRARRLAYADERLVAELALDRVYWQAADDGAPELELEIELTGDGRPADLAALQAALAEFNLAPQPLSKFARGLARLAASPAPASERAAPRRPKPKAPAVRADQPMAEAGRALLRFHFEKMLAQEAGARAGADIEAVHAMRVATRRQRAALALFGGYFEPKALRPIRRALKAVAARLGAVRDLDVQLADLRAYQAEQPPAAAQALEPLAAAWEGERAAARVALLACLDSAEFRRFCERYQQFLATAGQGVPPAAPGAPLLVRDVLPARLWEHYGAVCAYAPALPAAADSPPPDTPTLHALRIAGKRLRYALEFFAAPLGPAAAEAIAAVTALQDHLGALHDADVTLARLAAASHLPLGYAAARAVAGYQRAQQARLAHWQTTARRPFAALTRRAFRQALGRLVARL